MFWIPTEFASPSLTRGITISCLALIAFQSILQVLPREGEGSFIHNGKIDEFDENTSQKYSETIEPSYNERGKES